MDKALLDEIAEAAYNARRKALISGAYPKHAFDTPRSEYAPEWEGLNEQAAIQWLYREEAQAAIAAFIVFTATNGSEEAKQAVATLLHEMEDIL